MTYIDPSVHELDPKLTGRLQGGNEDVMFLGTQHRVPCYVEPIADGPVPDDRRALGVYRRDTRRQIGQFSVVDDPRALDRLERLLDEPRQLAMACTEASPGLVGQVLALVPMGDIERLLGGAAEEPWSASAGAEDAWRGEETSTPTTMGVLFLGQVVRFEEDRTAPDDPQAEALDLFQAALRGGLAPVVDRLARDLAP